MKFTKMHGLGNDYIYTTEMPADPSALSIRLSKRHFAIGSDGLILVLPSENADFQMRIFNADGSEAKMCGNGIRCVGKFVYDKGLTDKTSLAIDTLSGIKYLELFTGIDGKVEKVSVDMGNSSVSPDLTITANAFGFETLTGSPVSVGNPHYVIFTEDVSSVPLADIGPVIEHHKAFPGGVNAEFVQLTGKNHLRMRVWERGSGITMACGTGACASASAAVAKGYCDTDTPITVELDGGNLEIVISKDYTVHMTGPAATAFEGEVDC